MPLPLSSEEIRNRFLAFFKKRNHKIIPSASLVPKDDPSVLFNSAGMQPLMPYLLGKEHPEGTRLVNYQKCLRTVDFDEIGDNTHLTFFEMLGNWSLGDYFKQEAIGWSYEFLISKEEGLGLNKDRLYVTVFGGSEAVSRDMESVEIWKSLGVPEHRIYFKNSKSNWWSAGLNSPAGPSTEMFYDLSGVLGDVDQEKFEIAEDSQQVVEIWNDVFMVYKQEEGKVVDNLPKKNVDTGAGLERITTVAQGKQSIYETNIFAPIIDLIKQDSKNYDEKAARIVADHLRSSAFLISDGVIPGNKDQGYILRRLIRRAIFKMKFLTLGSLAGTTIINHFINLYSSIYPNLSTVDIKTIFRLEEEKFLKTLQDGMKEFEKLKDSHFFGISGQEGEKMNLILGEDAFNLWQSYGFPIELTEELAREVGMKIDKYTFDQKMKEHQELSRTASAGMFKGGLANHNEQTIKLHTAHHLLLAALQTAVSPDIKQRGSNITEERLRIDFLCDHKLTDEEKKKVEEWVNDKIDKEYTVVRREMALSEAQKLGAEMEFGAKYPEMVSVYFIEDENGSPISKEFCGGPHVANTRELGVNSTGKKIHFKIQKEEAVSAGVRRIKAILE
jgi:alanyl-tRNA synthetase